MSRCTQKFQGPNTLPGCTLAHRSQGHRCHPALPCYPAAGWTGAAALEGSGPCCRRPSWAQAWAGQRRGCSAPGVSPEAGAWWGHVAGPQGQPCVPQPHWSWDRLPRHPWPLLPVAAASAVRAAQAWLPPVPLGPAWCIVQHTRRFPPPAHSCRPPGAGCRSTADTCQGQNGVHLTAGPPLPSTRVQGPLPKCPDRQRILAHY